MGIKKHIRRILWEQFIEEDYPVSFNMEEFKKLTSFNARIQYCQSRLKRISSGSSRIVYQIDEQKVLKLARNKKGLAQNEAEHDQANDYTLDGLVTEMFDYHPSFLWVEMEFAQPLRKSDFQKITGFSFEDYYNVLKQAYNSANHPSKHIPHSQVDKDIVQQMWNSEDIYPFLDYVGSYNTIPGDLGKTSSYGVVNRGSGPEIILVDFGLTPEIVSTHYTR